MSLLPFGLALILRFFGVPSRPVFSLVGLYILVLWLLPESIVEKIFGELDGDIEMFFLSGIFMVVGATILTSRTPTSCWPASASSAGSSRRSCRRCGPRSPIPARPGAGPG